MKRLLSIGIILLFIGLSISTSVGFNLEKNYIIPLDGKTLYVGGSGPGNYSKIQDSIDNASDGDMVFVFDDSSPYNESLIIDKSINLIGEDRSSTIIDGKKSGGVVRITSDYVTISGFTIQNSGYGEWEAGVFIEEETQYNNITDNIIKNNGEGILIMGEHHTISNNEILHNDNGTYSTQNTNYSTIKCNNIYLNNEYGICFSWIYDSQNHIIKNNNVRENKFTGIRICGSDNSSIIGNNVSSNGGNGISVYVSHNTTMNHNVVSSNNFDGIHIDSFYPYFNNTIIYNMVSSNKRYGINVYNSHNNNITGNNIAKNNNCGLKLERSEDNSITDNILISNNGAGIHLKSGSNNNIISNFIINNSFWGIHFTDADKNTITLNNIDYNKMDGMLLYRSLKNIIKDNNINYNKLDGIFLHKSINNTIKDNIIDENDYIGINLANSNNNTIKNNHISKNLNGIYLNHSNNYITYNTISRNFLGIGVVYSYSTIINHNNFIRNIIQTSFQYSYNGDFLSNCWDGNYWNRPRILPKLILGLLYVFPPLHCPWLEIDWHPAKEPYDIRA